LINTGNFALLRISVNSSDKYCKILVLKYRRQFAIVGP